MSATVDPFAIFRTSIAWSGSSSLSRSARSSQSAPSTPIASLPAIPETMAARALIVYPLAAQRPMMGAFLDALGIAHEEGVIQAEDVRPDPARLAPSVDQIAGAYPSADVALYLNTLV